MRKHMLCLLCVVLSLGIPLAARAVTVTWSIDNPSAYSEPVIVDFEGTLTGISAVTFRAEGYGGGTCCNMSDMEGNTATFWLSNALYLWLEPVLPYVRCGELTGYSAITAANLPLRANYDLTLPVNAADWSFLEDGQTSLLMCPCDGVEFRCTDPWCSVDYEQSESMTVTRLAITVTCDSAVPADLTTWGTVKSCYR